jgi:hypothetical protein
MRHANWNKASKCYFYVNQTRLSPTSVELKDQNEVNLLLQIVFRSTKQEIWSEGVETKVLKRDN